MERYCRCARHILHFFELKIEFKSVKRYFKRFRIICFWQRFAKHVFSTRNRLIWINVVERERKKDRSSSNASAVLIKIISNTFTALSTFYKLFVIKISFSWWKIWPLRERKSFPHLWFHFHNYVMIFWFKFANFISSLHCQLRRIKI